MGLGRVFISSVFGGMLDLRRKAADAARLIGLEPVETAHHVAQASAVEGALSREIANCDTYIGVFDKRRGTIPPGTGDRAITEEEFRIARELGLRCLVFFSTADSKDREPGLNDFLEKEVSDFTTGVWARPYADAAALTKEIAAALSTIRPRVILALKPRASMPGLETAPGEPGFLQSPSRGAAGSPGIDARVGEATLYLSGLKPAWTGDAVLGPVALDLDLSAASLEVFRKFQSEPRSRNELKEDAVRFAGSELARHAFPGEMGKALEEILTLAAHGGRLVTLEIRTGEEAVLALPWELISFPSHPFPVRQGLLEIVRRIPPPGADPNPERDPAPEIPSDHLSVLGFTAAPLEDQAVEARPGLGGMGDSDLFWEREQERLLVALDSLMREKRGRLILPDTGDVEELRSQLTREDRPRVLHLSCHGGTAAGRSVVFLEDEEGHRKPVSSDDLLTWIRATPKTNPIELLVLSACDTATPAGLTETLVRGGVQRVVGMQSAISDDGATAFAEAFYSALGRGTDLPTAFRAGRAGLSGKGGPYEWAIPVLTVSRDSGPLTTPEGTAKPLPTPFEVAREDFKIAGVTYLERGYVGRRETERRLRRAFEREQAIAIYGLGGLGKSTLAARFLERRKEEGARLLIVNAGRELAPAALIEEVAGKLGVQRDASASPEESERKFRADLQSALREVTPTILLLDNFEDQQDQDGNLRNPDLGEALADLAVLGGTGFRLFFTSRLPVELPDASFEVYNLDLGELSPSGCRKLRFLDPEGLGSLKEDAWSQVLHHLGGHPKALELLGGYLRGRPERARMLLDNFGPAIQSVDRKLAAKHQERGRSLLIGTVLSQVPPERFSTLDRLCLLEEPLPAEELEMILTADGITSSASDIAWLRDHGLLARKVSPSALAGGDAVHRLLSARSEQQKALANREGEEAVRSWHLRVAELFEKRKGPLSDYGVAARHRDKAGDRAGALEDYDQWAMNLRNRHAYGACVQIAREGLVTYLPGDAESERVKAAALCLTSHDGLRPLGAIADANRSLEQALDFLGEFSSSEALFQLASTRMRKGSALVGAGRIKEAEAELELAAGEFSAGGHSRDRAIVLGDIARLRSQSGDVAGALKLHEERLGIFEQLEDVRERAVTLGDIARLRAQLGDVAGALKLHEERLGIFEQLGDVRSRAVTLGDIARLRAQSGDVAGALKLYDEILGIVEQLGDVRGRAVMLGDIARLRAQSGDVTEARKLQTERLEVNRGLGDLDGIAIALLDLAQLDLGEEKYAEALPRLAESWSLLNKIGRADGIAIVGQLLGSILASAGMPTEAATVLGTAKDASQRLGWEAEVKEIEDFLRRLTDRSTSSEADPPPES